MFRSSATARHIQRVLDSYTYGYSKVMDIFYDKYQTLEAVVALAEGKRVRRNSTNTQNQPSPVLSEYEEFLKTETGRRLSEKWIDSYRSTIQDIRSYAIRYIVFKEPFIDHDIILMLESIDKAVDSITRRTVISEKRSRTSV